MAGAGVPVPMDDGIAIAAVPEIVCPLPGVARSGQKWRRLFAGNPPPRQTDILPEGKHGLHSVGDASPDLWELGGGRECGAPSEIEIQPARQCS
eukprot:scaffold129655_cov102-Phaeocystis_antarctica.AAC.1